MGKTFAFAVWTICAALAIAQRPGRDVRSTNIPEVNPYSSTEDIASGEKLYRGRCGHCHGQSGEGGRGAVINSGQFRHGGSDRELYQVIRNGIPNTEMPGASSLPEIEVWRMVAYVKQLGKQGGTDPVTGDAAAGAAVYQKSACSQCHSIGGAGGFLGPDLTDIGAKRAARHLRESIANPSADIPLEYRPVSVLTKTGSTIGGIHLNEDEYSVQLRDMNGALRSFLKSEIKMVKLPADSLMPSYASMPKADLENLVAYLDGLRPGKSIVWRFDRLENIGGHKTTMLGHPRVVDSPLGRVVLFGGVEDALFIDNHPLAGAETFTLEAIFRPDGGEREQRWFHLSQLDAQTGADTDNRMLFEIRVVGDQWYLDSFNQSGTESKALMNREALHPLGAWRHVATVYDGKELRNYVDGVLEGSAQVRLTPHGAGHTSVGVRINRVFYFKGAVHSARFTNSALAPSEFLPRPAKPNRAE